MEVEWTKVAGVNVVGGAAWGVMGGQTQGGLAEYDSWDD